MNSGDGTRRFIAVTARCHNMVDNLQGPSHIGAYVKSQVFQGLLLAKFRTSVDRDTAVALLRGAEMHEKGKRVWTTQDLPMMQRVQQVFMMGPRWQLGE